MEEIRFTVEAGGWCWCWFCSLLPFFPSPFRTLVEEAAMSSEVTAVRLLKKENKERCCAMSFEQTNFPTFVTTKTSFLLQALTREIWNRSLASTTRSSSDRRPHTTDIIDTVQNSRYYSQDSSNQRASAEIPSRDHTIDCRDVEQI
jgi:hypothetical protein